MAKDISVFPIASTDTDTYPPPAPLKLRPNGATIYKSIIVVVVVSA